MPMPLVAYVRVSGRSQLSGDGLDRQKERINEFCLLQRATLAGSVEDGAVSGTLPWHERPGLLEILKLPAGTTVLIERVDRLSRDLLVGELILQEFRAKGLKCIAVDSGLELTEVDVDPSVTFIRQIMMAVAQYDKSSIVRKLKHGRVAMKAKTGRCEGGKPYGTLEGERSVLDLILEMRDSRKSYSLRVLGIDSDLKVRRDFEFIAKCLNMKAWTTRAGHPWTAERVRRVYRTWKRGQKCATT